MNAVAKYFEELTAALGTTWNRFWFTPIDPATISLLRILAGTMACWLLVSFFGDLTIWFGADGLLPIEMARQLLEDPDARWSGRASYLFATQDPKLLMTMHVAGLLIAIAFTIGLWTRVTSVLTLVIVLSYVHRGPTLMGQFEPVLTLVLFYQCFAPCHRRLSVDHWLAQRRNGTTHSAKIAGSPEPSIAANISQRLIQVHVAALYLMMGLTKLGSEDWWNGEAMWWLIAHTESRLVDLTFLHQYEYLINLWTHAVVLFELLFGLLIWNRLGRPLLLTIALLHWIPLALVTGLVSYSVMMLVANLSFVQPETICGLLYRRQTETKSPPLFSAKLI